ncbi:hypothetical protein [Thermoactinospora rubra]|uniref:hypothetical protein n=1 Tax=Thermoactinospora rubra TaxID=1088767 RepID=UPI00117DF43E|nr:hypothetical protein [Thermoactinospora rubra]
MTALSVAYPDYSVSWSAYDSNHACFNEKYGVEFLPWIGVSPRLVSVNSLRPMFTVDLAAQASIISNLGPWRMTDAIQSLGNAQDWPQKAQQIKVIGKLNANATIKVVVRLVKPLAEAEVRTFASNPEVFLFAPRGSDENPISWDWGTAGLSCASRRGFDFCHKVQSATASFQKWVSQLRASDSAALGTLGLSLSELQEQAENVRIHGIVVQNTPEAIVRILKEPAVASAIVADAEVS